MQKILYLIGLCCLFLFKATAQPITFEKLYSIQNYDLSYGIRQTTDSGFVFIAQQGSLGFNSILLVKTDAYGDTLWTKTYCGQKAYWLEVLNDGGLIICGNSPYYCYDTIQHGMTLMRTNYLGDTLWVKKYGTNTGSYFRCVQETNDGGFIACGNGDTNLIKTDSAGNLQWARYIPVNALLSVKQTNDSGYIVAGYAGVFVDPYYIAKLDTNGFIQWYKTFYSPVLESFTDIIKTQDSGFIATGESQRLYKVNSQGDSIWASNLGEGGWGLNNTSDGGFIVGGGVMGMNLIKWDSALNIEWTKYYDPYSNFAAIAYSVQQTSDGGYIACGRADSGGIRKVYLVKTDSLGNVYTGLNEIVKEKTFSNVYPNPMQTEAQLLIENFHYSNLKNPEFLLYDLTGKQINTAPIKQWPFIIKRNNLQSGMYFYRVSDEKGLMLSGKLIMQ